MELLKQWFNNDSFMPHGHCYLWLRDLLWLNIISDSLIALAYLSIPVTLAYFVVKRKDLPFNWMFIAFGVFILACGATHVMDIWTIWHPDYWQLGMVKAVTAAASIITAIALVKLVPVALRIPSHEQLQQLNAQLRDTNEKLGQAQRELIAKARQAGMAEIAINVLHNVGNVLNSVNISLEQVTGSVQHTQALGLGQAVHLVREKGHEFGRQLEADPKGRQFIDFLEHLSDAMAAERSQQLDELGQLAKNLEHIKQIVATQQAYAGSSSIIEQVFIPELFDDVLRIQSEALGEQQVKIIKSFAELPALALDRHRLMLILINLVSNAKHAMAKVPAGQRRMVLSVESIDGAGVRIGVSDNGQGIAADQLTSIFSHGYTTRQGGRGFGLHSSALAAREMGGQLAVSSAGAGLGATFTLELPVRC